MTNCPNCGAPLDGSGKCKYCGTTFEEQRVSSLLSMSTDADYMIECTCLSDPYRTFITAKPVPESATLIYEGQEIPVYVSEMKREVLCEDYGRDIEGRMLRANPKEVWSFVCTTY